MFLRIKKKKKLFFFLHKKKIFLFIYFIKGGEGGVHCREITKDRVGGVPGNLVLGCITDQALRRSESNKGGSGSVTLIIRYYLYSFILPHCHARVRCTKIYPNRRALSMVGHCRRDKKLKDLCKPKLISRRK